MRSTAEPLRQQEIVTDYNGEQPLMVARGIGGRIELYRHAVRIVRHGFVNFLLTWLGGRPVFGETVIPISEISSFDIIQPVFFNDFLNVAYPGSPPLTGQCLHDSLSENSLLMNFFDNRAFYALRRRYETLAGLATAKTHGPSSLRAPWHAS